MDADKIVSTRCVVRTKSPALPDFCTCHGEARASLGTRTMSFAPLSSARKFVVVRIGAVGDDAVRIDMLDDAVERGDHLVAMTLSLSK